MDRLSFLNVLNSSKGQVKTPDFVIRYASNNLGLNRYSVVTTKKISKLAVARNALKRQIYDLVANIAGSHDIIIYPKNEKISSELHSAVSKIS